MRIEGEAGTSNGYAYGPMDLSTDQYAKLTVKLSGTENARFYIDVMDTDNGILFKTDWQETPTKETVFTYDLLKGHQNKYHRYPWPR